MKAAPLDILLLFDDPAGPPEGGDYSVRFKEEAYASEADVLRALRALGHRVRLLGIFDDLAPLLGEIKRHRPDVVFNLTEAFSGERHLEPNVVALLELLELPYTGAGPEALHLCRDKGVTKMILAHHGIRVPEFHFSSRSKPVRTLDGLKFPVIVKPRGLDASEGISQLSLAANARQALERTRFIHESLDADVIIEEFIEGRDLYVGVLGNGRLTAFPPCEMFFPEAHEGDPKIATYKAKWDKAYRRKWGIRSGLAPALPAEVADEVAALSKRVYSLLKIRGYARIDLRLGADGALYFIEANPNPCVAADDELAISAMGKRGGRKAYEAMVGKIVALGLAGGNA